MAFIVSGNVGTPKTIGVTPKPSPGLLETPDQHTHAHLFSAFASVCLKWVRFYIENVVES